MWSGKPVIAPGPPSQAASPVKEPAAPEPPPEEGGGGGSKAAAAAASPQQQQQQHAPAAEEAEDRTAEVGVALALLEEARLGETGSVLSGEEGEGEEDAESAAGLESEPAEGELPPGSSAGARSPAAASLFGDAAAPGAGAGGGGGGEPPPAAAAALPATSLWAAAGPAAGEAGAAAAGALVGEEAALAELRAHPKHVFVFSSAGKPVFSLHGDEGQLAGLMAAAQALMSVVQGSGQQLRHLRCALERRTSLRACALGSSHALALGSSRCGLMAQLHAELAALGVARLSPAPPPHLSWAVPLWAAPAGLRP